MYRYKNIDVMLNTKFSQIVSGDSATTVFLTAAALREVVSAMYRDEAIRSAEALMKHREQPVMTRKEAAEALKVSLPTLWRWDNIGYLKPVKIGAKSLYRAIDIDRILNDRGDKCQ